jgi:hypothetical protein
MYAGRQHGYYLRSQNPLEQTVEVLRRFDLGSFSRRSAVVAAMLCWALKERVIGQLEPLQDLHNEFRVARFADKFTGIKDRTSQLQKRLEQIRANFLTIRELFRRLSGQAGLQLYYPQIYKNGICTLP